MEKAAFTTLFDKSKGLFQAGLGLKAFKELLKEWEALFEDDDVSFERYKTTVGCLVFESEINSLLEEQLKPDQLMAAIHEKFFRTRDKRCEVGQVLSHIKNKEKEIYNAFKENAQSVALILKDESSLFKDSKNNDYADISSVVCSDVVGIDSPDDPEIFLHLCPIFYYDRQLIPDAEIFGSGYMIAPNIIVTAGHVVQSIRESGCAVEDVIFILGMDSFGAEETLLKTRKDRIYRLRQENVQENSQIILGEGGDSAWLIVEPYHKEQTGNPPGKPALENRIPAPKSLEKDQPVYALGHGLGVPMKLSFGGNIEHPPKGGWIGCNLDIFPGNSGSPIFHANTHELLGIISGPDNLWQPIFKNQNCVSYEIDNSGNQSVQTSDITPLIHKFQNP